MHSKQLNKSRNDQPQDRDTFAEECEMSEEEGKKKKGDSENTNTNPPLSPNPSILFITVKVHKLNSFLESFSLVTQSSDTKFVCTKKDDGDIMFIEITKKYDDSHEEDLEWDENTIIGGLEAEYFDIFTTRSELAYHKEDPNRGVTNFTGRIKGMHIFVGNFTYVLDFMIVEDISSIIDPRLSQVVLGKPFVEVSNMNHDLSLGVVKFTNETIENAYKMPHKIEQYNSLSDLEKVHIKSVYLRNDEDKRRVHYVMNKILGFYKECLELGPKYLIGLEDEGGVT
nr:retrotransposon Orf1 [Tanacetum cinerariifolium]